MLCPISRSFALIALLSCVAPAAMTFAPATVHAQDLAPKDKAAAKALFNAGLALETAGDYTQALTKFREFLGYKTTPQGLYHVARCLERLGKWTEAIGTYRLAIEKAEETGAKDVIAKADEERKALEGRLPKLVIQRGTGAESAVISLDGVALGATAVGSELPIDPGPHAIVATAGGKTLFKVDVSVSEAEVKRVTIEGKAADEPPPVASASSHKSGPMPPRKKTGYMIGAAGLGGVVAGTIFLVLRQSRINELEDKCQAKHCPAGSESTKTAATTYTILGDGFLGLGLIGVGVGSYLILTSKSAEPAKAGLTLMPGAPGSVAGATFGGQF